MNDTGATYWDSMINPPCNILQTAIDLEWKLNKALLAIDTCANANPAAASGGPDYQVKNKLNQNHVIILKM